MGKEGYVTVLADTNNSVETERSVLDSLCSRQVDGLLLATALLDDGIVAECQKRQVPFVLVNRTVTGATATSKSRHEGFIEAMNAYPLKADPRIMFECKSLTSQAGDAACRTLIQSRRPITAIVAANDLLALGCYAALGAAGSNAPPTFR